MTTTFAQLGVPSFVSDALERRGITAPFEIQAVTIADALAGRDVCGRAPTGSGKTLAFGVPLVATLSEFGRSKPGQPSALILAPTRELAEQITGEIRSFSGALRVDAVYGGVGYGQQLRALGRGVDILVACPGRLEDLIGRGDVDLSHVRHVVLDEADRMADMGFMPSVRRLLDQTPSGRQTVLFSATLDGDVAKVTRDYQSDPVRHEVGEETPDIRSATHHFWKLERMERNPVVAEVVKMSWPSIIFCRTRHGADRLAKQIGKLGIEAAPIHGGRSQSQRNRALDDFTKGRVHALVATDVAARGIHVDGVASVIHYDPPEDHKAYVHRSGRTARAGAEGLVVSLLTPEQVKDARRVQRQIGLDEEITAPDLELMPEGALTGERELAPALPGQLSSGRNGQKDRKAPRRSGKKPSNRSGRRPERTKSHQPKHHERSYEFEHGEQDGRDGRAGDGHGRSNDNRADRSDSRRDRTERPSAGRPNQRSGKPKHASKGGKPKSRSKSGNRNGQGGTGQRGNGRAGSGQNQRPNRKSRRAHLQPGARQS